MYQMLFGRLPFVESGRKIKKGIEEDQDKFPKSTKKTEKDIVKREKSSKLRFPRDTHVSDEVKSLIHSLLHPKSKKRPSAAKVICHRWFRRDDASMDEDGESDAGTSNQVPESVTEPEQDHKADPHRKRRSTASKVLRHKWFRRDHGKRESDSKKDHHNRARRASAGDMDAPADPMAKLDNMIRLSNLRKYNPNSQLKQAVLSLMVSDMLTNRRARLDLPFNQPGYLAPKAGYEPSEIREVELA
ncbi:unknown protein [Seminavis robusta]|uniref:Protein kinase domain-containing protein n=1 Tax=Seminavis robusta TaxID=568900 RepID=A0A9N8DX99_9STRA|nr:unknown protein [Seminavis robusta]|eukprot:Sro424_g140020.1 n/a (244) ;mRNA; f:60619-61350